jgi:hypothetical protein
MSHCRKQMRIRCVRRPQKARIGSRTKKFWRIVTTWTYLERDRDPEFGDDRVRGPVPPNRSQFIAWALRTFILMKGFRKRFPRASRNSHLTLRSGTCATPGDTPITPHDCPSRITLTQRDATGRRARRRPNNQTDARRTKGAESLASRELRTRKPGREHRAGSSQAYSDLNSVLSIS